MPREADAYCALAMEVIPLARSAGDLRNWWEQERSRRRAYALSDDQIDDLTEACKEHVLSLGERVRE